MGPSYIEQRARIETYFDRTAVQAWARLTSDAPVGRIRATVRAGRAQMRRTLLEWLPPDLSGKRVLDAGCGTGLLAIDVARRGGSVVAVDLSPTLIGLARQRVPLDLGPGGVDFHAGDMLDPGLGHFDYVLCMDSLIHYRLEHVMRVLAALSARTESALLFTFAPRTGPLAVMHAIGRLFPQGDRAPALAPVAERALQRALSREARLHTWRLSRSERVASGFYTSQAVELVQR